MIDIDGQIGRQYWYLLEYVSQPYSSATPMLSNSFTSKSGVFAWHKYQLQSAWRWLFLTGFGLKKAMIYWIYSVDMEGSDNMICILMQYLNKGYDVDHLEK